MAQRHQNDQITAEVNLMRHSIIAWDSSYRDFFHLVQGACEQDYNVDQYELIYVEQRSKEHADSYAKDENVQALSEIKEEVGEKINFRVLYLDDPLSNPYHLGKCVNEGISVAQGEYISVMDGDQLLPPDFLSALDEFHSQGPAIANVIRQSPPEPVGVSKENWKDAIIDYDRCLELCEEGPIPETTPNYGPLISAPAEAWEAVNGYSTHKIWSTGLSKLGADVNRRLERYLGVESRPLPDTFVAHPWHPTGFDRNVLRSRKMFEIQDQVMDYSEECNIVDWTDRIGFSDEVYRRNKAFVDRVTTSSELAMPGEADNESPSLFDNIYRTVSEISAKVKYDGITEASLLIAGILKRYIKVGEKQLN